MLLAVTGDYSIYYTKWAVRGMRRHTKDAGNLLFCGRIYRHRICLRRQIHFGVLIVYKFLRRNERKEG